MERILLHILLNFYISIGWLQFFRYVKTQIIQLLINVHSRALKNLQYIIFHYCSSNFNIYVTFNNNRFQQTTRCIIWLIILSILYFIICQQFLICYIIIPWNMYGYGNDKMENAVIRVVLILFELFFSPRPLDYYLRAQTVIYLFGFY